MNGGQPTLIWYLNQVFSKIADTCSCLHTQSRAKPTPFSHINFILNQSVSLQTGVCAKTAKTKTDQWLAHMSFALQPNFQPELYNDFSLLLLSVLRIVHVLALAFGEPTKEGQGQCRISIKYYYEQRRVLVSFDWRGMTTYAP